MLSLRNAHASSYYRGLICFVNMGQHLLLLLDENQADLLWVLCRAAAPSQQRTSKTKTVLIQTRTLSVGKRLYRQVPSPLEQSRVILVKKVKEDTF